MQHVKQPPTHLLYFNTARKPFRKYMTRRQLLLRWPRNVAHFE